ncbi:hypothetical protein H1R20_g12022, partial [Candolleomyces eurysporus]
MLTISKLNLFHFDRSGAQHTPLFNIHDKPGTFIRLILGLCAAEERTLGLDDTVQWSVGADGRRERGTVKTFGPEQSIVLYDLVMDEQPFVRTNLRGRGTICWSAKNAKGERFIIKDYWVSGDQATEFGLLEEVKGLRGICQMVSHEPSRAQTTDFRGNMDRFEQSAFRNRTATRIVMKAYSPTIENFSSVEQVLAALRDAIAGMEGTRMFQSLMVLRTAEMKEKEISAHDYLDDLEAFFWVFSYLVCFYRADGTPAPKSIFQAHPQSWLKADPVDAHRRKLCFLSLRGIVCEAKLYMDDGWRFACADLFFKFREYMWKLADRKEELAFEDIEGEPDESGPNKFASMLKDVDEHYNHILGLFDEALKKTRAAARATSSSPDPATQPKSSSLSVSQAVHVSVAAPANESPISPQRRATSSSSTDDQPTVVTLSPSTPSDPATLIVTSTSSRGSKRRSHEAHLKDSPTQVKRQRPASRRLLKATR